MDKETSWDNVILIEKIVEFLTNPACVGAFAAAAAVVSAFLMLVATHVGQSGFDSLRKGRTFRTECL